MKHLISTALALVCVVLAVALIVMKQNGDARRESDAAALDDLTNRLTLAHGQISYSRATMLTLSNRLDESQSALLTLSNRLVENESIAALYAQQVTNLNLQVAAAESENQTLDRRVMDLTNQVARLTQQIAITNACLAQACKDFTLLENRLRRNVAERLVTERKFYNPAELQRQMDDLKLNPARTISRESIYAGLDVEVTSNGTVHLLSPN